MEINLKISHVNVAYIAQRYSSSIWRRSSKKLKLIKLKSLDFRRYFRCHFNKKLRFAHPRPYGRGCVNIARLMLDVKVSTLELIWRKRWVLSKQEDIARAKREGNTEFVNKLCKKLSLSEYARATAVQKVAGKEQEAKVYLKKRRQTKIIRQWKKDFLKSFKRENIRQYPSTAYICFLRMVLGNDLYPFPHIYTDRCLIASYKLAIDPGRRRGSP